jgi:hypothetical protein
MTMTSALLRLCSAHQRTGSLSRQRQGQQVSEVSDAGEVCEPPREHRPAPGSSMIMNFFMIAKAFKRDHAKKPS